jgi:hypothetical protein
VEFQTRVRTANVKKRKLLKIPTPMDFAQDREDDTDLFLLEMKGTMTITLIYGVTTICVTFLLTIVFW